MTQIVTGSNAREDPPTKWGPLNWRVDGFSPAQAQAIMRAFMVYTHSLQSLADILEVGIFAAEEYLNRANAIPKHVAIFGIPKLLAVMKANPARLDSILKKSLEYTPAVDAARIKTAREINTEVAMKAAGILKSLRLEKGITQKDLAEKLGIKRQELCEKENNGITPYCNFFFPLCEELGISPECFGFISYFAGAIYQWRRLKRIAKRGNPHGRQ